MLMSRYAANAITLPSLDMYSNLLPSDAMTILDHLTPTTNTSTTNTLNAHWRGRYGCSETEQANIWSSINPSPSTGPSDSGSVVTQKERKKVELRFKTYEGDLKIVQAGVGDTLLQVARENDLPSMEGSCGGNLGKPDSLSSRLSFHLVRFPLSFHETVQIQGLQDT